MNKQLAEQLRYIAEQIEKLPTEGLGDDMIEHLETAVECIDYVLESA